MKRPTDNDDFSFRARACGRQIGPVRPTFSDWLGRVDALLEGALGFRLSDFPDRDWHGMYLRYDCWTAVEEIAEELDDQEGLWTPTK
jgi:hypothetical protein